MIPASGAENSPVQAPVQVGDTVAGKYMVERVIAKGGMGVVVAARHIQLDRSVALKFMLSELLAQPYEPDAVARFLREGRAAARLRGENVARVLDVATLGPDDGDGSGAGTPYMVMEYLEGVDLKDLLIERGPLPAKECVDYVLQACVAMAEAHALGIVHRDLKPDNLFLTRRPDGSPLVKVLDFGISKLYEAVGEELDAIRRTRASVVMGSPAYMSPEQARSARDADARSDIWSLGIILYELSSRRLPFNANVTTAELLAQLIYQEPIPLAQAARDLPTALCAVVDRCLAKNPDGRYQDVAQLATGLAPFATSAGRATVASICAMVDGPEAQTTRHYGNIAHDSTQPWLENPAADQSATTPALDSEGDAIARALESVQESSLAHLDSRPGNESPGANRQPDADRPDDLEIELDAPSTHRVSSLELDPPAKPRQSDPAPAAPSIAVDRDALARVHQAGMSSPFAASAGGMIEHELDPRVHGSRLEPVRVQKPHRPGAGGTAARQPWLDAQRGIYLATIAVLAALTIALTVSGAERVVIDQIDNALHRAGHSLFRSAGITLQLLGGTILQLAVPLLLILIVRWRELGFVALAFTWWLGESLGQVSRYVGDATTQIRPPLAGDTHAWAYLLSEWDLFDQAATVAQITWIASLALMLGALALMLRRAIRYPA